MPQCLLFVLVGWWVVGAGASQPHRAPRLDGAVGSSDLSPEAARLGNTGGATGPRDPVSERVVAKRWGSVMKEDPEVHSPKETSRTGHLPTTSTTGRADGAAEGKGRWRGKVKGQSAGGAMGEGEIEHTTNGDGDLNEGEIMEGLQRGRAVARKGG